MVDLRTTSGSFFVALGVILLLLGVFSPGLRASLTEVNINLYCGIAMLAFGGVMLLWARTRS